MKTQRACRAESLRENQIAGLENSAHSQDKKKIKDYIKLTITQIITSPKYRCHIKNGEKGCQMVKITF